MLPAHAGRLMRQQLLARLGQCVELLVVTIVCFVEQAFAEPTLVCATFVTPHQQDGLTLGVKGKRNPPDLAIQ